MLSKPQITHCHFPVHTHARTNTHMIKRPCLVWYCIIRQLWHMLKSNTLPTIIVEHSVDICNTVCAIGKYATRVNMLRSIQSVHHFPGDVFKSFFLNETFCIAIQFDSLKFVAKGLNDNKWSLIQIMAFRRTGDKPLSEPMLTQFTDAYLRHLGADELM